MWFESYWWNNEVEQINEWNNEQIISSFNDAENNIQKSYEVNKYKDWADILALKQYTEYKKLKEQKEKPILNEVREQLDREAMINEAKTMLYEKLWINDNLESNNWWENFAKWIVDTLILDNYDLAIQVWETNWVVIIDWIKELFSSWENIKKLAEALWDSVMWLFSWEPYELWKSIVDLWLIWTWIWAWIKIWKKWIKIWIKQISKLRKSAERVVESSSVKKVIWETTKQIDEIIPKKELDIDAVVKKRVDIQKKIEWLEKLWISESFSKDMLESWLLNEKFYWWDLLKRFKALENKWIDYNTLVDDVIKQIPDLTREEALLIFTYTDDVIFRDLNSYMRGVLNKELSEANIIAINNIIDTLESWLSKMPDIKLWKEWFILRWDKWEGRKKNVWEEIELDAFTSVANNKRDAFIWDEFDNNIEISIIWKEWRIKDVSELSIAVNYWVSNKELVTLTDFTGKLKNLWKTTNEWIVLPNSKVIVLERVQWKDMYYTRVKQTK